MECEFFPQLSQNLLEVLDEDEYYDITIEVGKDPYVKIFRAHMAILNHRSPYLRRILSTNKKGNDGSLVHIKLPNILPEIFHIILRYIYGGRLSLKENDTADIIKILVAAIELGLKELIIYLQTFLIKNKTDWMEKNFNLIYLTSFENESLMELQKFCNKLISKEPQRMFESPNFSSISEKVLVSLIQNENLRMSEIQIWEHVLNWGIAQNPELPSDPESFSKDDFDLLKNTLKSCIPFIRFYDLTCKEFSKKVLPYKKILPKELYKELLNTFLDLHPDSKPDKSNPRNSCISKNIDSKIITSQHAELISKWIDRLGVTDKQTSSYGFKLILRGSRDGFTPSKFHEVCDNQSRLVTIIKVMHSEEILGGYNPTTWKSGYRFSTTRDSFIFSFKNNDNIENFILSRVKDEEYAILNNPTCGPSFGNGDLILSEVEKSSSSFSYCESYCEISSYEKPIREIESEFAVEEYEIFQIIKY
ncbi:hypothetical protein RclHR1_11560003 [Rhizophagus clarus]|uniref:Carbohydrate-binding module family 13 protein n=1 Tax=Rhizophagus clarus TaxID=94130 RepID=A0A2Z6Q4P9_9GLOM|nr:hypothetical protein RclHR1_11560003 [Rhizophagus clarus]GES96323.1 carbohydrate-binding module family 13 protein [Rhizophagus clarus]